MFYSYFIPHVVKYIKLITHITAVYETETVSKVTRLLTIVCSNICLSSLCQKREVPDAHKTQRWSWLLYKPVLSGQI